MISRNIDKVKDVLTPHHGFVVVSAYGKRFDGDTKVTDLLYQLHQSGYKRSIFDSIASRYKTLVAQHAIKMDIERLLDETYAQIKTCNNEALTVSKGEQLSAKIAAVYLNANYVEAADIVKFGKNGCDIKKTLSNIRQAYQAGGRCVMGGFYGSDQWGNVRLFSRGGGDISGALAARAINASVYENWTDVNGLCVANPRLVSNVRTVPCVSYNDMYLLARNGAEVLHPSSIHPVMKASIPIHIRNIYNKYDSGTVVSNQSSSDNIIGVAHKRIDIGYRTVVVYKNALQYVVSTVLTCLQQCGIEVYSVQGYADYAVFTTPVCVIKQICDALLLTNR